MKHKILIFLLALGASTGALFAESGTCGENLTWDLTDGVLTISGTGAMTDYAKVSDVPWYNYIGGITNVVFAEGCGITTIGDRSFVYCSSLTSIAIPNSVTTIGDYAFYGCSSLASVTISNSVVSIGYASFYGCTSLASITIPNSVTNIGDGAFADCTILTSVTIGSSVTTIPDYVFYGCSNITSVIWNAKNCANRGGFGNQVTSFSFGNEVESIPNSCCSGMNKLTSITIPSSVTSIESGAFSGCSDLTSMIVEKGNTKYDSRNNCNAIIETSSNILIAGCKNTIIPNSVTSIGNYAFEVCSGLTEIVIPNSVTSIGKYAFRYCSNLFSVSLPDGLQSIGAGAFDWCNGLPSITIPDGVTNIGECAFNQVSNVNYHGEATGSPWCAIYVNGYVEGYLVYADETKRELIQCSTLASGTIVIPNSVTIIAERVFDKCKNITSIVIPEGVTSIGEYAFCMCSSLTEITLPSSLVTIGDAAFSTCTNLSQINIPDGVESIGWAVFRDCSSLPVENDLRYADTYLVEAVDKTQATYTIREGTKWIGAEAFMFCANLTNITIPNGVIGIGRSAFNQCKKLASVTIPNSVKSIEYGVFRYCSELSEIFIPSSVVAIRGNAFIECTGLTSLKVDEGNSIYDSRDNCNAIIETATNTLISGCQKSIIPSSVTKIGDYAFAYCSGLSSVTIPDNVTSIGDYAFYGCTGLTSVTIPEGVTSIGLAAFENCSGLTSVTIPNSITSIRAYTFSGCTGLTSVTCYATIPPEQLVSMSVGKYYGPFSGIDLFSLVLYVPAESIEAYKAADGWKEFGQIRPIAKEKDVEQITFIPESNTADVAWPKVTDAASYELIIRDTNGELVDSLVFDADGRLLTQISFAPARGDAPHKTQTAGFAFTITGLESNTTYYYILTTKNESGTVLDTQNGSFITKAPQDIENTDAATKANKVCRNGQILIQKGDKTYTLTGQIIKQ